MENFILSSTPIEISEFPNHKEATFLISVLDEYNLNNVMIEKEDGEKYHKTIVGYPIVAYLKYDKDGKPNDFGGHELRAKYNSETKEIEYYFATYPIGSVIDSWIEKREVDGYEGEKDVILIKTKLWKSRLPEYFKVFDKLWEDGSISSSWEISSSKVKKTTKGKILKVFEFIGNCLLGSSVSGAVPGAGVLEVASNNEFNYELSNALAKDILTLSNKSIKDEDKDDINKDKQEGGEELMDGKENLQVSAITENDLYSKVRRAINSIDTEKYYYLSMLYPYEYKAIAYTWNRESEQDFVEFTYSVNSDDTISVSGQKDVKMVFIPKTEFDAQVLEVQEKLESTEKEISEAGKAITELTKEKEELETQISELGKYKEKVEEMEQAEREKELSEKKDELKTFALEDNLIEEAELESDERLMTIFSELTLENFELSQEKIEVIKGRRAIEKFKASKQKESEELETSEEKLEDETASANIADDGDLVDGGTLMSNWLSKK